VTVTSKYRRFGGTSRQLIDVDIAPGLDYAITLTPSARNRRFRVSLSADVLRHVVAIDVYGMSNSKGS